MNEALEMILVFLMFLPLGIMGIIFMLYPYLQGRQLIKLTELEVRKMELRKKEKVKT